MYILTLKSIIDMMHFFCDFIMSAKSANEMKAKGFTTSAKLFSKSNSNVSSKRPCTRTSELGKPFDRILVKVINAMLGQTAIELL